MSPTESRLSAWSHQGAVTGSKHTYNAIRTALETYNWTLDIEYNVYLQGSYRNSTNIRGNSDVDVVVQLERPYSIDEAYGRLGVTPQLNVNSLDLFQRFKTFVENAMVCRFGLNNVTSGNKAIRVKTPYLAADVVPCIQYRKLANGSRQYIEGMIFYVAKEQRWVVNFPKYHYNNGISKNQSVWERYKPTIRVFKNAKSYIEQRGLIPLGLAPSYFVECMIYNVPNFLFVYNLRDRWTRMLEWLCHSLQVNSHTFQCQNGQLVLFGSGPENWSVLNAQKFILALTKL